MALTIDKGKTAFLSMHFLNDLVHEDGKFAISGTSCSHKTNELSGKHEKCPRCMQAGERSCNPCSDRAHRG